jgi:hypothetical protein
MSSTPPLATLRATLVAEDARTSFEYHLIISGFIAAKALEICVDRSSDAASGGPLGMVGTPQFWLIGVFLSLIFRFFHGNVALARQVHALPLVPLPKPGSVRRSVLWKARAARFLRFLAPYVLHPSQYVLFCLAALAMPSGAVTQESATHLLDWLLLVSGYDVLLCCLGLALSTPPPDSAMDLASQRRRLVQRAMLSWGVINGLTVVVLMQRRSAVAIDPASATTSWFWFGLWCAYLVAFFADYIANRHLFFSRRAG